ncbi:MAG TPA: PEMT/PEM2 methyltransferase family protein [Gemmatimonadales bacterium]|nr:PEMT/PEM2 methyltransferase family protein [Gemmatimonadales bacterium]
MTANSAGRDPSDSPRVVILPPLLYVAALAAGLLLSWAIPQPILSSATRYWIGGVLAGLGVLLAAWGRSVMERAGTNVNPMLPTTALVTTGPFRRSRNPLYVALTLMYVGLALLTNSLWVLALLVPVLLILHYGVVRREERYLEAKFGDAYRAYRARVRRYL